MFNRTQMKLAAKDRLARGGRWMAVLICAIAALLGGGVSINGPSLEFKTDVPSSDVPSFGSESMFEDTLPFILALIIGLFSVAMIIGLAYTLFFGNIIKVGFYGWFLRYSREEVPPVPHLFLGFRIYGKALVTMLLHDLYVMLWTLLFIVPGIIKGLSYSLVPYILYENPKLSAKEALALSAKMMDGWKMAAFELHLSFIGWRLLSVLTLGVLDVLFVNPYFETAYAMFYDTVRYDALYVRQVVTYEELDVEPSVDEMNGDTDATYATESAWDAPAATTDIPQDTMSFYQDNEDAPADNNE